jgi:hypothetical protein
MMNFARAAKELIPKDNLMKMLSHELTYRKENNIWLTQQNEIFSSVDCIREQRLGYLALFGYSDYELYNDSISYHFDEEEVKSIISSMVNPLK